MGAFMGTLAFKRLHKIWATRMDGIKARLLRGGGDTYEDVQMNRARLAVYEEIFRDMTRMKGEPK